jgi:AraC-like DNA-binding protein
VAIAWDGPYCPYVHVCDDSRRPWPWRLPNRRLAHYLLVVSFDGDERIEVDGRAYRIPAGGGYLIAPGQLHTLSSERGNRPAWIHFDVRFDPRRASHPYAGAYDAQLGPRARLLQPSPREVWDAELPVALPEPALPALRGAVPRVISAWQQGGPWRRWEASHELGGLLLQLVMACVGGDRPAGEPVPVRLARAEAVARRSLGAEFGVAEFAAAAGYSRSRFCALYRANRGIGPGAFLRQCRLALGRELLRRRELTVRAVGGLVGYPEPSVFARAFHAAFGATPQAWRDGGGA